RCGARHCASPDRRHLRCRCRARPRTEAADRDRRRSDRCGPPRCRAGFLPRAPEVADPRPNLGPPASDRSWLPPPSSYDAYALLPSLAGAVFPDSDGVAPQSSFSLTFFTSCPFIRTTTATGRPPSSIGSTLTARYPAFALTALSTAASSVCLALVMAALCACA